MQVGRHRPGVRGRGGRQVPRGLGVARRPGQRHQQQVQRARRADLLGPARGRGVARGERGLPAQLPAFVAVEGQGHLPLHPAMVHRDGPARCAHVPARELCGRASAGRTDAAASLALEGRRGATLRQLAMQAIADTRFVPEKGRNRLGLDGRGAARLGDQPPARVGRADRAVRRAQDRRAAGRSARSTRASSRRSAAAASMPGTTRMPPRSSARPQPRRLREVTDILDVWFDSGCTHVFTLESGRWPDQRWPADLYLEGSRPAPRLVPVVACSKAAARAAARRTTRC